MFEEPEYLESLGQRVKHIVIEELRYYFQTVSQFGTPASTVKMPLIREAYGLDIRNYPAVFVKILSSRTQTLGIGRGFVQDVMSDDQLIYQEFLPGTEKDMFPKNYKPRAISERYGFLADVSLKLEVWADTTEVRNRMVDEITSAFQTFQKGSLQDKGIVIERVDEGEESDFPLNDTTKIFIANITLVVNAELYFDKPVASITEYKVYPITSYNVPYPQPDYIIQDPNEA